MAADKEDFPRMAKSELIEYCKALYKENGISSLSYPSLRAIPKLYNTLYANELSQRKLLIELGVEEEYRTYSRSQPYKYGGGERERWSWDRIVETAIAAKNASGSLPPALWFQKNGKASLIQAVYNLGHSWADLREAVGDFVGSNFVQSRNGIRWLSHAEASLSNFLYARGISHKKGERYSSDFRDFSSNKYAFYDLHFQSKDGNWIDVEVWGDKPNGHGEEKYAKTRKEKELYNSSNRNFLGIHHSDCYDEKLLGDILADYIGLIDAHVFDKPTDKYIYSTHWSNADELLEFCIQLAAGMPNGEFPAEDWLRKRGRWANRDGEAYNTLSVYIKTWLGGTRNLRRLIGQSQVSTQQWSRDSAIKAYKNFFENYGLTAQQVRHEVRRKKSGAFSEETVLEATRIASAVQKYAGGAEAVNRELGISPKINSKWSNDNLTNVVRDLFEQFGLSPNQLLYDWRKGKIDLEPAVVKLAQQAVDASTRHVGGLAAVYTELGITPPSRKRDKRRNLRGSPNT